jgi:Spx/MgsR family transcriptional regulator
MKVRVYGIGSCDGCRRARRALDQAGIEHDWVDLRETPPDRVRLQRWIEQLGNEVLVNRRSTTWRQLSPEARDAATDAGLTDLLEAHPTLIKRPLIEHGDACRVGFDANVIEWLRRA